MPEAGCSPRGMTGMRGLQPSCYLAAMMSTGRIFGSAASSRGATVLSAAGMPPLRCAFLASSVANVSNMPYTVSPALNACQVTVVLRRCYLAGLDEEGRQGVTLSGGRFELGQEAVTDLHVLLLCDVSLM
jgi:hypothetical protein